jgi:hypothetical protein
MGHHQHPQTPAHSGKNGPHRNPLPAAQSIHRYRALHGEKIRQYYAVGDPVEHMRSVASNRRIGLALLGILIAAALVILVAWSR